jgi:hypothetical protein
MVAVKNPQSKVAGLFIAFLASRLDDGTLAIKGCLIA